MKKYISFALAVLICISFVGCADGNEDSSNKRKSGEAALYQYGLEVIGLMQEKAGSRAYQEMMTTVDSVLGLMEQFASVDLDEPTVVYRMEIPKTEKILKEYGVDAAEKYQSLSPELQKDIDSRIPSIFTNGILGRQGSTYLACGSLLATTKDISALQITEKQCYLYVFESGVTILVTFAPNGSVSGSVVTMFDEDVQSMVKQQLKEAGVQLTEVKTK